MSEEKQSENDPERTLLTLDQLSQTIEVMTNVVNRLRQHLSEQLKAQAEAQQLAKEEQEALAEAEAAIAADAASTEQAAANQTSKASDASTQNKGSSASKESFVVEIRQQDSSPTRKNNKTLH